MHTTNPHAAARREQIEKERSALALGELMDKWDTYRARWIEAHGSDAGFGAWFFSQVPGMKRLGRTIDETA